MYTGAEITTGGVIPVTHEQMEAFSVWANGRYASYAAYKADIRNNAINEYIRTHIFTPDMQTLWNLFSEPHNPAFADPVHFSRLLTYRDRLTKKITYMKTKLGKHAFPQEARVIRARLTEQRHERERQRIADMRIRVTQELLMQATQEPNLQNAIPSRTHRPLFTREIKLQTLSPEEANKEMEDDCAICMIKHAIRETCTTPCGHHFGTACLDKWKHAACPLCRSVCSEVTQYVEKA